MLEVPVLEGVVAGRLAAGRWLVVLRRGWRVVSHWMRLAVTWWGWRVVDHLSVGDLDELSAWGARGRSGEIAALGGLPALRPMDAMCASMEAGDSA